MGAGKLCSVRSKLKPQKIPSASLRFCFDPGHKGQQSPGWAAADPKRAYNPIRPSINDATAIMAEANNF